MSMGKTIIFILNSIEQQRCHKRIAEFIANGYEVKVYAFNRKCRKGKMSFVGYQVRMIGEFVNTLSYWRRIGIIRKGIKKVVEENKDLDGIYYLFNFDVASIAYWMIDKPYIYEESDLMHTYISNAALRKGLNMLDEYIIRNSLLTVMTSDGFVKYHFKGCQPDYVCVIPNKLNPQVKEYPILPKEKLQMEHVKFGFVGDIRGKSLANFTKILATRFPQHEMHFFGGCDDCNMPFFEPFKGYKNIFFHGPFRNPCDLAKVYSQIDIVVSTYDAVYENVLYAEPNKIYEAIYFETPSIVSTGTFLAEKVRKLGIGVDMDAMNDDTVCDFIRHLTAEQISERMKNEAAIDKDYSINENTAFFRKLKQVQL